MTSVLSKTTTSAASDPGYTRLHITPLDADLLSIVLPASVRPDARNISYHNIQTFPEKRYGFVELPTAAADKLRKKLNGAVLKGVKLRIEAARAKKKLGAGTDTDDSDNDMGKPQSQRNAEGGSANRSRVKNKAKYNNRRGNGKVTADTIEQATFGLPAWRMLGPAARGEEIQGVQLEPGRHVKRGWTETAEEAKESQRQAKKQRKEEKTKGRGGSAGRGEVKKERFPAKKKKQVQSKYRPDKKECLIKTVLPAHKIKTTGANSAPLGVTMRTFGHAVTDGTAAAVAKKPADADIPPVVPDSREKRKRDKKAREVVVHEFANTTTFPSWTKTTTSKDGGRNKGVEYVDSLGWVNTQGDVVQPLKSTRPPAIISKATPKSEVEEEKKSKKSKKKTEKAAEEETKETKEIKETKETKETKTKKSEKADTKADKKSQKAEKPGKVNEADKKTEKATKLEAKKVESESESDDEAAQYSEDTSSSDDSSEEDDSSDDTTSSDDTSSEEDDSSEDDSSEDDSSEEESEEEDEAQDSSDEEKAEDTPVKTPAPKKAKAKETATTPMAEPLISPRPRSSGSGVNLHIKIPPPLSRVPVTPADKVHPLEALYKIAKADDGGSGSGSGDKKGLAAALEGSKSFSFNLAARDADIDEDADEEDDGLNEERDFGSQQPMTPFTKEEFDWRHQRSAAPTPDTAHPTRVSSFKPWAEEDDEDADDDDDEDAGAGDNSRGKGSKRKAEAEASRSDNKQLTADTDFEAFFWDKRGDNNRAWKQRRRAAAKDKRYQSNKSRASRAI